jgi:5'-nucleotidase
MKLLLTNDDGIDAPGLAALEMAAAPLGDMIVVAPDAPYSGCGHTVTTDKPFRVMARDRGRYAVGGTPADCVRVALNRLAPETAWVLAGINAGGNLGADVYHSGTVAAAREAALHGWPAVAVSHYKRRGLEFDWPRAARWAAAVLSELLLLPAEPGLFWNINLPHLARDVPDPPVMYCPLDPAPLPLAYAIDGELHSYNGDYHTRRRGSGTDVDVCFGGGIAVTALRLF